MDPLLHTVTSHVREGGDEELVGSVVERGCSGVGSRSLVGWGGGVGWGSLVGWGGGV